MLLKANMSVLGHFFSTGWLNEEVYPSGHIWTNLVLPDYFKRWVAAFFQSNRGVVMKIWCPLWNSLYLWGWQDQEWKFYRNCKLNYQTIGFFLTICIVFPFPAFVVECSPSARARVKVSTFVTKIWIKSLYIGLEIRKKSEYNFFFF